MKAILVIDMPDICYKCPCYDHEGGICQASDSWKTDIRNGCPLRQMPKEKHDDEEDMEDASYMCGWNDCLKEIVDGND